MEQAAKQKTLDIQRGLFLIRYESTDSEAHPPKVMVSVDAGSERNVELILPPDAQEPVMWSPGAGLVVRAVRPGRLLVAVAPTEPNGSVAAKVQLVGLSSDPAGAREQEESASADLDLATFRILGHVAGIGDVYASGDEWIAGPMAPSRIEGIAIEWPEKPQNVGLRYAVRVGGQNPANTQFVEAGNFAGTRGRALPVVGATMEIGGPGAQGYQLAVDSIFLGSPQMRVTGQRVVLSGPTGREPLVGLRVEIEPVNEPKKASEPKRAPQAFRKRTVPAERAAPRDGATRAVEPAKPAKQTGRVRVFRGGTKKGQDQSEL